MITSKVTPPTKVEGVGVDGAEGVGGATEPERFERNYASLRSTIAASIAPMTGKWLDTRKGTEKWHKILVIAKGR